MCVSEHRSRARIPWQGIKRDSKLLCRYCCGLLDGFNGFSYHDTTYVCAQYETESEMWIRAKRVRTNPKLSDDSFHSTRVARSLAKILPDHNISARQPNLFILAMLIFIVLRPKLYFWQTTNTTSYCRFWPIIKQLNALAMPCSVFFSLSLFSPFSLLLLCFALLSHIITCTHIFCAGLNVEYFSGHFQNVVSFMRTISFQQCGKYNKYWITKAEARQNSRFCWKAHTH